MTFPLIGQWVNDHNVDITFHEDGYFEDVKYRQEGNTGLVVLEENEAGKLVEVEYGKLKYEVVSWAGDSMRVNIVGEKDGRVWRRMKFVCENDQCIRAVFKGAGLENHLQYAEVLRRPDYEGAAIMKSTHLKFIIPEDYHKSEFYVAFEQEGIQIPFDQDSLIFEVPQSGLIETTFRKYLKPIVFGNVSFEMKRNGKSNVKIPSMTLEQWTAMMENLKAPKEVKKALPFNLDEQIVLARSRFNPSREFVNEVFGKTMQGNVLDFRFTTIRQELKMLGYYHEFFLELK